MKKQFIFFLSVLIFLVAINSCKKTEEVRPDFDQNVKIVMAEKIDSVKRVLSLMCYTENMFPCSNYAISTTHVLTTDKITINFLKVDTFTFCTTAIGPASAVINFTGLPNKTYAIELNFGTTTITGQLVVTANSFVATLPAQTKVQFLNPDLKRIQDNTIYGKVGYHTASSLSLAQTFIDTLQLYGATPVVYPPGDYREFQIDANGQIIPMQDGYYFRLNYIFKYSNSSGKLKDLVKRFGTNYPNLLSVSLNTTKGETFYGWVP